AELYAPGLEDVDRSLGRLDERLTLLSLTQGREQAWRLATVYSDAALAPLVGYARWVHRATATGAAQFIRSPPVDPAVLEAMAAVEREAGVEAVTRALAEGLDRAE
ncbi:MAG: hypothetical protein GWN07_14565, partial [Actinobacteria bacterium]|nr:hypothetical protein [Actinomycetota bacterium]NIW28503.1 hypothetical protein [Actinomycetota bacterium]NIX20986.1 hypothetical protein [Actinomycetota bacterium]